jgi:hypothetical protein
MRTKATAIGFYTTGWNERHSRLQRLTIAELLDGKGVATRIHGKPLQAATMIPHTR